MTDWEDAIEAASAEFVEQLEQRGFHADGRMLTGDLPGIDGPIELRIELPDAFPFTPPIVSPPNDYPCSWHRELSGAMCLYPADGRENLPWLDVDNFLRTVARWLDESASGWTADSPDLDLERYFPQLPDEPLVVYGDLDSITNRFIGFRREKNVTRLVGARSIPKGTQGLKRNRAFGYLAALGEPDTPPASWEDLKVMLPAEDAQSIESAVRDRRLEYLIVRYSRGGVDAAATLRASRSKSGTIELAAVRSASEAPLTLALRAGPNAEKLSVASVAVVGAGAIGSFLCDLLARAGIGTITVYDPDVVRPGNLIRHLAGADMVGLAKVDAIKHLIESRPFNSTRIRAVARPAPPPQHIMSLFGEHDLVIDASAAGGTTDMLVKAATAGGHRLLTVCIQAEGGVVRVDVVPPLEGDSLAATDLGPTPSREDLRFEAGCGDPVSQTSAFAVLEAASLAARCAVGMLMGVPICTAGIIRDYR
ncbi:ThiF family adenylyltransferase [Kribbella sp. NPDC048928]|uniref:ThiF family adenylyltransferase n=1 Tax=Kribbella sp. NPDC048928 TaxID=3364111 RepID=UPI00371B5814